MVVFSALRWQLACLRVAFFFTPAVLAAWVEAEPLIHWVKPEAGTTALLRYDLDMSSREFCVALLRETGVMFTPGSALGMEGYVRIGYANTPAIVAEGLRRVSQFLADQAGGT